MPTFQEHRFIWCPSHITKPLRFSNRTTLTLCTDGASVHPVLKDFSPNRLCWFLRNRRIDRCWPTGSSGATTLFWCVSILFKLDHQIDRRFPPMDRRFIRCCYLSLLPCNWSEATRKWTAGLSDGALVFTQCTNSSDDCTDAFYLGIVGSSDDVLSFSFLSCFWPLKNRHVVFWHPWDLEMSAKTF
jgi:hypothetical protein